MTFTGSLQRRDPDVFAQMRYGLFRKRWLNEFDLWALAKYIDRMEVVEESNRDDVRECAKAYAAVVDFKRKHNLPMATYRNGKLTFVHEFPPHEFDVESGGAIRAKS